jgi:hypothetical protein
MGMFRTIRSCSTLLNKLGFLLFLKADAETQKENVVGHEKASFASNPGRANEIWSEMPGPVELVLSWLRPHAPSNHLGPMVDECLLLPRS